MTELIACLSTGKGTWGEVSKLIAAEQWDNVFLVANDFARERFNTQAEFIMIDDNMSVWQLTKTIHEQLASKVRGVEVALNLSSGSGKEHMALISAVLQLGVGIRFVVMGDRGLISL